MKELCFKSILLCFCLLLGFNAFAYDAEIDGIYYYFLGDEATVTSGNFGYSYSGSVIIPESVTYEGTTYSVTSIGYNAFNGCKRLTSITIPNSVTSIGNKAFSSCSGLTSIVVESTNTVFDSRNDCNAIIETATNTLVAGCKNTTIPSSVTSIGNSAFYDCISLTSITIPNSVTSIGDYAFYSCI